MTKRKESNRVSPFFLAAAINSQMGWQQVPNVPPSAFEMVGKRFDSHWRSVCIARSLIAGEGGGEGRRWIGSANGLRAILFEIVRVLNYARLKIDISFWPSSLPFYGTMEKIDRFFYGVGQPSEKISTKRVQFRLSFRTGGGREGIMFDPRGSKGRRGASRGHVNGLVSFSGQGKWPMSFGVIDGDAWNAIRHAP